MTHNHHDSGPYYTEGGRSASDNTYPDPSALELPSSAMGPGFGNDADEGIFGIPPLSPGSFTPVAPSDHSGNDVDADLEPEDALLQAFTTDEDIPAPIPQQLQPDPRTESPPPTFPDQGLQQFDDLPSGQTAETTQSDNSPQTWPDNPAGDQAQSSQHQQAPRSSPTGVSAESDKNFASSALRDMANNGLLDQSHPDQLRALKQAQSVDEFLRSRVSKAATSTPSARETATSASPTQGDHADSDVSATKGGETDQGSREKPQEPVRPSVDGSSPPEDSNSEPSGEEDASNEDAGEVQPAVSEDSSREGTATPSSNAASEEAASTDATAGPGSSSLTIAETFNSDTFNLTYASPDQARGHAFRRIPLAIDNDDVAQVKANEAEHVKEIMRAIANPDFLGPEKQKRGDRKLTQEEQDEWNRWQNDSSVVVEDALANFDKPSLMRQIEAKAWLIYEEIVKVHESGYRPSENVDVESKCSRRLERAIECIESFTLVREDILKFMDVHEFAASPKAYGDKKVGSCWVNLKKKQNKAALSTAQPKSKTRATGFKSSIYKCNFSKEELDAMEEAQTGRKKRGRKGKAKGVKGSAKKKGGKVGSGAKKAMQDESAADDKENEDATEDDEENEDATGDDEENKDATVYDEDENVQHSNQAAAQNGDPTPSTQNLADQPARQETSNRLSQVDEDGDDDLDADTSLATATSNKRKRGRFDDAATSKQVGRKPKKAKGDFETAPRRSARNQNTGTSANANLDSGDASKSMAASKLSGQGGADGTYVRDEPRWSDL